MHFLWNNTKRWHVIYNNLQTWHWFINTSLSYFGIEVIGFVLACSKTQIYSLPNTAPPVDVALVGSWNSLNDIRLVFIRIAQTAQAPGHGGQRRDRHKFPTHIAETPGCDFRLQYQSITLTHCENVESVEVDAWISNYTAADAVKSVIYSIMMLVKFTAPIQWDYSLWVMWHAWVSIPDLRPWPRE